VAAVLLAALLVGALFIPVKKKQGSTNVNPTAIVRQKPIVPGANKAYLTLSNGTKIVLDDAKNGALASQPGMKISKAGSGVVIYEFIKSTKSETENTLSAINTVTTPRGGQYQVLLEDGTHVWLNAASSIRFPQAFHGPQRLVELSGEAYFEVAKDKTHPFIVQANGAKVQVFGTHFNINAYPDNNSVTTTLLEGSVQMSNSSQATMLVPGEQGVSTKSGGAISVSRADIQQAMAWKNGYFIFHDLSIVEVMKQVSRWYDVDIQYQDEDVKNNEFGGAISRYKSITELLDNMQLTRSVHYRIEGRRVIIMK
jgi:ferric-dicitrate binding protein FerR (iron transport regulator)